MKPGMRFSPEGKAARFGATASPANRTRKALLRKIQRQELRKLQSMLPGSARSRLSASARKEASPVAVINSVIDYIDTLQATILARVRQGTLPPEVLEQLHFPSAPSTLLEPTSSMRIPPSSLRPKGSI